jgi:hypothetical protein
MSKTIKDKEFWKLRNLAKKISKAIFTELNEDRSNKGFVESQARTTEEKIEFKKIHGKYGFKSMVFDKRRRNNSRKSNQKTKKVLRRVERAKGKYELIKNLKNYEIR